MGTSARAGTRPSFDREVGVAAGSMSFWGVYRPF